MKIKPGNGWKTLRHGGLWWRRIYGNWYPMAGKNMDDLKKLQTISWSSIFVRQLGVSIANRDFAFFCVLPH